jgi:putative transposase
MYGCQQVLINADKELAAILEYICSEAAKLTNCGTYYSRQMFFKTGKIPGKYDLHKAIGTEQKNVHYRALLGETSQQILTTVAESFKSYLGLLKAFAKGVILERPRLPSYRKGGIAPVPFTGRTVKFKNGLLRFPLGQSVKAWFGIDAFYMAMPTNLDYATIREYRILPRNECFYLELIYEAEVTPIDVDADKVLGIDHGIDNWLTCVSNVGTSLIVDGLHLKSLNQWFNKRVSVLKENQPQGFWSKQLANITEKRNRQMRDAVNKAAKIVVNHCIKNGIGTIAFGWNKRQKDSADMGAKTNQKFVQIPSAKLKNRIAQLGKQYGIRFLETEESYTSKASFVDNDLLPTIGEKPDGWQESGKRTKRGLYRTAQNWYINADCNGAANILRKVATTLGIDLSGVSRGALTTPLRVRLWTLKESPSL